MQRILVLLALGWLAGLAKQDSGANTPSYDDLLEAVRSGKFEVASKPQLPDPKSELEDILSKSNDYKYLLKHSTKNHPFVLNGVHTFYNKLLRQK